MKKTLRGGGCTCCVPGCNNNTKKNRELSFHKFPRKKLVRERWINAIKRKNFVHTDHHRVCSQHFHDGKKKGYSDIPMIFPLLSHPKLRKEPKLHEVLSPPPPKKMKSEALEKSKPLADALVEELSSLC